MSRQSINRAKATERNRNYIYELLTVTPCIDCGHSDWRVLTFDHLPEHNKRRDVCELASRGASLMSLQKEIDKCEIVCFNCHVLRTMKRGGFWRQMKNA